MLFLPCSQALVVPTEPCTDKLLICVCVCVCVSQGMGEPLANYEPVRAAVRTMTDSRLFALCRRHVTISTVGVIPRIKQLAQDLPVSTIACTLDARTYTHTHTRTETLT